MSALYKAKGQTYSYHYSWPPSMGTLMSMPRVLAKDRPKAIPFRVPGQSQVPWSFHYIKELCVVLLCPPLSCPEPPGPCRGTACAATGPGPNDNYSWACASALSKGLRRGPGAWWEGSCLKHTTSHSPALLCPSLFLGMQKRHGQVSFAHVN